jgi:hypothetical protein
MGKCDVWMFMVASTVLAVVAYALYINREWYGGPIKNSKKIPMTTCRQVCNTFGKQCASMVEGPAKKVCEQRRNSCHMECHYSNMQRM